MFVYYKLQRAPGQFTTDLHTNLLCLFSANVLLDEAYTAKLSDFGIARFLDSSTNCGTECTSKIQGTNAYLAPEASRGTVSIKMDSFALSVVSVLNSSVLQT